MENRNAKPENVLLISEFLKSKKSTIKNLKQFLMKKTECTDEIAIAAIKDNIHDGILVPIGNSYRPLEAQQVKLFTEKELTTKVSLSEHDWYCFECFLPGDLTNCQQCTRAFHSSCYRKNPLRPNYPLPATNLIAEYERDEEDNDNETSKSNGPSSEIVDDNVSHDSQSTASDLKPFDRYGRIIKSCKVVVERMNNQENINLDTKNNLVFEVPEVVCLGQVRPPTRQKTTNYSTFTNNSFKNESFDENRDEDKSFCTCCRLLRNGKEKQPPNMLSNELCHLISYTFKYSRQWLKRDIPKMVENKVQVSKKVFFDLIKKLFIRPDIMTLECIDNKIKNLQYDLLIEFIIDALDLQFTIGVLFGRGSFEFDSSKYFVRDLTYDVSEIQRCPDCFRHSNERILPLWFALPCSRRHELVYAKCQGHSYWPAKVVNVLYKSKKYDVRFFGGNHERSLVDSSSIRSIDSACKNNQKLAFKHAMVELQIYQALIQYSPELFSYNANRNEINRIFDAVTLEINNEFGMKRNYKSKQRKSVPLDATSMPLDTTSMSFQLTSEDTASSSRKRHRRNSPPKLTHLDCSSSGSLTPTTPVGTPIFMRTSNISATITIEDHLAAMNALREQLNESHQRELAIAKLTTYCAKCLQPAKFLCCINTWYCSSICQRQHWYEVHKNLCNNHSTSI